MQDIMHNKFQTPEDTRARLMFHIAVIDIREMIDKYNDMDNETYQLAQDAADAHASMVEISSSENIDAYCKAADDYLNHRKAIKAIENKIKRAMRKLMDDVQQLYSTDVDFFRPEGANEKGMSITRWIWAFEDHFGGCGRHFNVQETIY
ncbi:MAG: hypothetical protein LIO91_03465 [Bacteroidales bacterium]|nr:hypothetical protein [Bacteroidales bacterium]